MIFCKIKNYFYASLKLIKKYNTFQFLVRKSESLPSLILGKIYYGVNFNNTFRFGIFIFDSLFSREGRFRLYHNAGFYSCYSLLLDGIIQCAQQGLSVVHIDTTCTFIYFKDRGHVHDEIYHQFFQNQINKTSLLQITRKDFFKGIVIFKAHHAHYRNLSFKEFSFLLNTYFYPSCQIQNRIQFFIEKYSFVPENILAVVYRGTDKGVEVTLAPPEDYIDLTKKLLQKNPHLRVLIQTDQAQVRKLFCDTFGDKCFYIEELPATESRTVMHDVLKENKLDWALNFDAAIRLISQSKILINHTGNVAFFLALYRGCADDMYQFDRAGKLVEPLF